MFFNSNKRSESNVGFSHLGEGASFEGEIHCKGEIEIAGKVKGNISAKTLSILETGKVTGHVNSERFDILGCMLGNTSSWNVHVGEKGVGGSVSFADPNRNMSFSFVMNRMSSGLFTDPRAVRLVVAASRCADACANP